jgi:chromosome segregation ATPase
LTTVVGALAQSTHPDLSAKDRPAAEKEALDQVLSLLKAALSQVGQGGANAAPVLQVHPETQTLIFKGSPEQRDAVEDVLAALTPEGQRDNSQEAERRKQAAVAEDRRRLQLQMNEVRDQSANQVAEMQKKLQEAESRLKELQTQEVQRVADAERAKIRLEEREKLLGDLNAKLNDLEARYDAVRKQQGQQQPSGREGGGAK